MVFAADIEVGIGPGAGAGVGARAFLGSHAGPGTSTSPGTYASKGTLSGAGIGARVESGTGAIFGVASAIGENEFAFRSGGRATGPPGAGNETFRSFRQAMLGEPEMNYGFLSATKPDVAIRSESAGHEESLSAGGSGTAAIARTLQAASNNVASILPAGEQEDFSTVHPAAASVARLTVQAVTAHLPAVTQMQGDSALGKALPHPAAGEPNSDASASAWASKSTRRGSTNLESNTNAQAPVTTSPAPVDLSVSAVPVPIASFPSAHGLHLPGESGASTPANSVSNPAPSTPQDEPTLVAPADLATADGNQFTRMPEHSSTPPAGPMVGAASGMRSGVHFSGPGNDSSLHSIAAGAIAPEEQDASSDTTGTAKNTPTISQSAAPPAKTLFTGQGVTTEDSAPDPQPAVAVPPRINPDGTSPPADVMQSVLANAAAETSSPDRGEWSPVQAAGQPFRRSQTGETARQAVHEILVDAPGALQGPSALLRAPDSINGLIEAGSAHANPSEIDSSGLAARIGPQEAWAALDAGTGVGAPGWTHAGAQHAEAGFQDPTLGWIGVRADLGGGNLHAALVPGSADAAQALSAHLPGLSAYLAEEHARVSTLTIAESGTVADEGRGGAGMSQTAQQGAGQEAGQRDAREPKSDLQANPPAVPGLEARSVQAASDNPNTFFPVGASRGTHISVVA